MGCVLIAHMSVTAPSVIQATIAQPILFVFRDFDVRRSQQKYLICCFRHRAADRVAKATRKVDEPTPQPILAKLHAAAAEALHSAEVKDKLAAQGVIAVGNPSAEFSAYVKSEIERWAKVINASGIKVK